MNRPLRRLGTAVLVMFLLLLGNANVVQVLKADDYRDDPRNSRVLLRTYARERGPIVIGSGQQRTFLARSQETDGRLKYLRRYPGGPTYAHVTGYFSFIYGASGIERSQQRVLSGDDDRLFVRRLSDQLTGREPEGGAVQLTLSRAAQEAAVRGLQGKRGAVVALDPSTGAVLAMASAPSFDPNRLSAHDGDPVRAAYKGYSTDDTDPLLNRAIRQTYPPGSTFKVVTAAAALADGMTPQSPTTSPKELDLPQTDQNLRNFGGSTCGGDRISLADALRISCNTAFGFLGMQLGTEKMREQAEAFGFEADDLSVPTSVATSRFPDELNPPQQAQSAIGQYDVRVTPLQMAMVAAGVANAGKVMEPHLVAEVLAPDLTPLDRAEPKVYREATSPEVAAQLTSMMELVVSRGSGRSAQIGGVRVAGKTGTAQHAAGKPPHAWFIGFAPADDPKVAVAVVVENGGSLGSEATGGRLAAPIARDVMRAVLGR